MMTKKYTFDSVPSLVENEGKTILVRFVEEEFKERVKDGGFFLCHWDGTEETEAKIKEETQATIRCVPYAYEQTPGVDMVSGKPAKYRVILIH